MRKPSEIEIWRSEDMYSLNARPFIDKNDLAGMIDRITLEKDVLFSSYCQRTTSANIARISKIIKCQIGVQLCALTIQIIEKDK